MGNYPHMIEHKMLLCVLPVLGPLPPSALSKKLALIWCCKIWEVLRILLLQSKSGLEIWPWKGFRVASAPRTAEPGCLQGAQVEKTCPTIAQECDLMFWRQMCWAGMVLWSHSTAETRNTFQLWLQVGALTTRQFHPGMGAGCLRPVYFQVRQGHCSIAASQVFWTEAPR